MGNCTTDGAGNSIPFEVYAQSNGIVVDAGPDGITRSYQYEKNYCGQEPVPGNQYPNRGGVFYWTVPIPIGSDTCGGISGVKEIYFVAVTGEQDDTISGEVRDSEEPATGYYPFGLSRLERENNLQQVFQFTNVCSSNPGVCVDQPGRQLIIWYDVANDEPNDGPNRPEIQTVYYHVAVDTIPQYGDWRSVCSGDRDLTWTQTMIESNPSYDICKITTALSAEGFWVGQARRIGFATAPHLHYEVHIDRYNDGSFDGSPDFRDREDPLMAFWTIR